ncbi:MAG TPA: GNAT family N-acetyltransferase [Gemmatimonadaceae bacterium]|nr:GNAT family N-acetyltransferase [Gemmatimonadaceae bacterium]
MELAIRSATPSDVPALVDSMSAFYAEAGFPLRAAPAARAFETLLADRRLGGAWLAEVDGVAVGHVVLTLCFSMEYGGLRGFIDDLYVQRTARGQGVAAALLDAVRGAALERDARALHVEVGPENAAARRLYARAGYVESGHLFLSLPLAAPLHES